MIRISPQLQASFVCLDHRRRHHDIGEFHGKRKLQEILFLPKNIDLCQTYRICVLCIKRVQIDCRASFVPIQGPFSIPA